VHQAARLAEVVAHLDAAADQPVGDLADLQTVEAVEAEVGFEGELKGHRGLAP
jgi:uncharacterized protein YihD (DUF1040 family)